MKSASTALEARRYGEAIAQVKLVRLPKLADYTGWIAASAYFELNDDQNIIEALKPVWAQTPKSPLQGRSALLAARTYVRSGDPRSAINILRKYADELAQPDGDAALATALEGAQDNAGAVTAWQRVYINWPLSAASQDAAAALSRLEGALGSAYPALRPQQLLTRALKLMDAGGNKQARTELEGFADALPPAERDYAKVRIGITYYNTRENATALAYLRGLQLSTPESEAERLFYVTQCARRLNNLDEVGLLLGQFAQRFPKSKWRVQALVAAANQYIVTNQPAGYEPLFRACSAEFADSPQAPQCHWHLTWDEYLRRSAQAGPLLKEHLRLYPHSDKAPAALYFLGRLAEQSGDLASARAYYAEINEFYPNYYYAVLARERLKDSGIARTAASPSVNAFLRGITFPPRSRRMDFTANAISRERIERARQLSVAGLDDYAEIELRYGARTENQPQVLGMALADLALKRNAPERAIRFIKRYAPGYLYFPMDAAPSEFWKLAFPLPYREPLERFAKQEQLDPFLVAALVRQESEFDTKVISRAKAYGLTQVLPSTGRELSRKVGMKGFTSKMLFEPAINLQLGTHYIRTLLDQLQTYPEATLAAYNAGKSRSVAWLSWHEYREAAEFVESIPFTETRDYVQIVIRNADVYRRLYGGGAQ